MKTGPRHLGLWLNKSFGPNWLKSSCWASDPCVKVYFNILGIHQLFLWVLDKKSIFLMKIGSRVLELRLGKFFWAKLAQNQFLGPRHLVDGMFCKILHRMRSCLQILDTEFCNYGFASLLVPTAPKLVLRPQIQKATFL